jgi:hypothetical protein
MLKRTKGRFLLTMLVITGLAGTIRDASLNKQERKFAVGELKETRSQLFQSIKGLSEAQLNYKPASGQRSIKECVFHIALAEKNLSKMLEVAMKESSAPEKRAEVNVSDEEIVALVKNRNYQFQESAIPVAGKINWKAMNDALLDFKADRANRIKYAKTTTEDLRDHFIYLPIGWVDAYQFMLFMSAYSSRYTDEIQRIKGDRGFPQQ